MRRLDPVKFEEKRQQILAAADTCFRRRGIAKTSIADICDQAGMGPGLLYHYFASKDEILDACFRDWVDAGTREFKDLQSQSNAIAALAAAIEQAKNRNLRSEFLLLLEIAAETGRNKKLGKILQDSSKRMRAIIADFIREGQKSGLIDDSLSPDAAAAILFAVFDGIRMMPVRDPQVEMGEALDQLQIMISRFLIAPRQ